MTYKTSLDSLAKWTTIIISILFSAIITGQILFLDGENSMTAIITSLTLLLIYFGVFSYRPIHYGLNDDELSIHRLLSDIKINRKEIASLQQIDKEQLAWSWRVFGVGGLFGYWGKFTNRKLGPMTWYSTRRDRAVLIITNTNQRIIITPDNPEKFVADFNV